LSLFFKLPQPGGPGSCIYFPQEQGSRIIPSGIGFLLVEVEVNLRPTVSRPVCLGVRRPSRTRDQFFFLLEISFRQLRVYFVAPSLTRGRVLIYCTIASGPCQSSHSWVEVPQNLRRVEVEVTLRPTVSRPVRLGVLPLLEHVTRCYIYLTRGRVCTLQCNDASPVSSYIATGGLSANSSWCRAPNGTHNQILISLFDSYFFSV
jgi:hypothetical protein